MTLDEDGYPDEETLERIEKFDLGKHFENLPEFIELIRENWNYSEWGFKLDAETGCLQLHTGGWSGNESIIRAIEKNYLFFLFWVKSKRGGHYWFELYQFDKEGKRCSFGQGELPE